MPPCETITRKGKPCPIEADRVREGVWYCHVHDPEGLYRLQVKANAADDRIDRQERRQAGRSARRRQKDAQIVRRAQAVFRSLSSAPRETAADRWLRECKANRRPKP